MDQSLLQHRVSSASSNPKSSPDSTSPPVVVLKARVDKSGASASQQAPASSPWPGAGNHPPSQQTAAGNPFVLKGSSADAGRNLVLAVLAALALIPIGGIAFWWAPQESFVALATSLIVGLLMVLALQFRLLLQRNGLFLLISGGLSLTLLVPIGVRLVAAGSEWARTLSEFKRQQVFRNSPDSNGGGVVVGEPKAGVSPAPAQVSQTAAAVAPVKAEAVSSPKPSAGATLEGATVAEIKESKESPLVKHASEVSVVKEPFPEDPAARALRATQLAKDEAIRRYPELQIVGTRQHTAYLDAYNALVRSRKDEFFKDPQWPLKIAEILAVGEGWVRFEERPVSSKGTPKKATMPGAEIDLNAAAPQKKEEKISEGAAAREVEPDEDGFAQAVKAAQKEVVRRYPAVGVEGSSENEAYQACFADLNSRNTDFFEKADWPLRLAELVAKQEGWKRPEAGGGVEKAGGAKISVMREGALPQ